MIPFSAETLVPKGPKNWGQSLLADSGKAFGSSSLSEPSLIPSSPSTSFAEDPHPAVISPRTSNIQRIAIPRNGYGREKQRRLFSRPCMAIRVTQITHHARLLLQSSEGSYYRFFRMEPCPFRSALATSEGPHPGLFPSSDSAVPSLA